MLRMLCLQDPNTPIEESMQAMKVCSTLCPTQALFLCWVGSLRAWPSTDLVMETANVFVSDNARPLCRSWLRRARSGMSASAR